MEQEKEIKVVEIISPFQVVLNCGKELGVNKGYKFLIYGLGKKIIDPDTKEELETLEIIRGRGKVVHAQSKICTVESIEIRETPKTIMRKATLGGGILGNLSAPVEETEIKRETLPFNEVQIGDLAKLI